jgi:hypothetical protein
MRLSILGLGLAGLLLASGATEQSARMTTLEAAPTSVPRLLRAVPLQTAAEGQTETAAFDEEAGVALLNSKCTTCHDLSSVERGLYPPEEWVETVDRMIEYGMAVTEEEYETILLYLGTAPGEAGGDAGAGPAADGDDAASPAPTLPDVPGLRLSFFLSR